MSSFFFVGSVIGQVVAATATGLPVKNDFVALRSFGQSESGNEGRPHVVGASSSGDHWSGAQREPARAPLLSDAASFPGISYALLPSLRIVSLRDTVFAYVFPRRGAYLAAASSGIELYEGQRRLRPGRWPRTDFAIGSSEAAERAGEYHLKLGADAVAAMDDASEVMIAGFFTSDYAYETAPLHRRSDGEFFVEGMKSPGKAKPEFRYFLYGAPHFLTEPGDFVLSRDGSQAAVLPRTPNTVIESARYDHVLVVENAKHLLFEGLTFEKSLGDAVVVNNSEDIHFRHCFFGHSGGRGIVVNGGRNVTIEDSVIADTSETGVAMSGGDWQSLRPADHKIINSVIVDFGIDNLSYRPGIELRGVGLAASGNVISRGPHAAVIYGGLQIRIEGNEISDVAEANDDVGAIYAGRNWLEQGNTIVGNYLHDIGASAKAHSFVAGVYLDDQESGTRVSNNAFVRVSRPIVIGGGRMNTIEDNVFVAAQHPAVFVDDRGVSGQTARTGAGVTLRDRVRAAVAKNSAIIDNYPFLRHWVEEETSPPIDNVVRGNATLGQPLIDANDSVRKLIELRDNKESALGDKTAIEDRVAKVAQSIGGRKLIETWDVARAAYLGTSTRVGGH